MTHGKALSGYSKEINIGTLNEGSLHSAMKQLAAISGDAFEVTIDGFVIDIVRSSGKKSMLFEVQTTSFAAMRKKLSHLLNDYQIVVIYPVPVEIYLIKPDQKRRKSPKKGTLYTVFEELVSIPEFLTHPNLSFEVVCVSVQKIQEYDPSLRRRRGGYRTINTELIEVHSNHTFAGIEDFMRLLPKGLPEVFTTADIATLGNISRGIAQQMAYCFRNAGTIIELKHTKEGKHYRLSS